MNLGRTYESMYKKDAIPEVLFFMQADLNELSGEEDARVGYILHKILLAPINKRGMPESYLKHDPKERRFANVMNRNYLDLAKRIQDRLRKLFVDVMESESVEEGDIGSRYELPTVRLELFKLGSSLTFIEPWTFGKQETEDRALVNFAFLLFDGANLEAVKKCQGCGQYFVNFSSRRKLYCNAKCTWKAFSRNRRNELKKHPRKYQQFLREQREYMWHQYEKNRKAQLGSKIKIKRRVHY